ncbi:MAG: hypothetical protein EOP06_31645, partial [Proteobacteria bacterium]
MVAFAFASLSQHSEAGPRTCADNFQTLTGRSGISQKALTSILSSSDPIRSQRALDEVNRLVLTYDLATDTQSEPTAAGNLAFFKGRFYPSSFYRAAHAKHRFRDGSYAEPGEVGRSMWFLQIEDGKLVRRKGNGAQVLLKDYITYHDELTLYRATTIEHGRK